MRHLATRDRIEAFLRALGGAVGQPLRAYLAGGTTAVLLGWRDTTIDVDLALRGDGTNEALRAVPGLKERLQINVELATPAEFIPVPPGWEERGRFELQAGQLTAYHFELVWQALAKIHRGHRQDLEDAAEMVRRGLVDAASVRDAYVAIEAQLYRFPNIDRPSFRRAVEAFTEQW